MGPKDSCLACFGCAAIGVLAYGGMWTLTSEPTVIVSLISVAGPRATTMPLTVMLCCVRAVTLPTISAGALAAVGAGEAVGAAVEIGAAVAIETAVAVGSVSVAAVA